MALRRVGDKKVWIYQTKINGKTWARSTGQTDKELALKEVVKLQRIADAFREDSDTVETLDAAIKAEVTRIKEEVSIMQSERIESAMKNFRKFAGKTKLRKIDARMLERYQKERLQVAALDTVNREIIWIRRILRLNGYEVRKPTPKPGRVTFQRAFTPDELKRFFDACDESVKPLYLFMLATGARLAELVPSGKSQHTPVLKSEVDLEKRVVRLRTAKQRQGMIRVQAKVRVIALPEWVIEPLRRQIARVDGDFVFSSLVNSAREFNRAIKRAKITKYDALGQKVTAHSFRHTYCTLLAEAIGNNPFVLKEAMGHSRLSMTERYCHTTAPMLEISIEGFGDPREGV